LRDEDFGRSARYLHVPKNKLRFLVAGIIGAGAVLLASAGASAHLGLSGSVSDRNPTPAASGAAPATIVDEVDAPEAASTPEPTETPEPAPTAAAAATEPAGANVEQEGEFQGQAGDTSGGDTGD
jgi:hypothetical protein